MSTSAYRYLPTDLFQQPAFRGLDSDAQSILIGMTLFADHQGCGSAHPDTLADYLRTSPGIIQQSLSLLQQAGYIALSLQGGQLVYVHLHWHTWQGEHDGL